MHRIALGFSLLLLFLSACTEGEGAAPQGQQSQQSRQGQATAAQLMDAMVDSHPGLKVTESDAQDHFQQLEDRLLAGSHWPAVGGDCLKRLSPGGFVRVLGETGTQAPAAMRGWGTEKNEDRKSVV